MNPGWRHVLHDNAEIQQHIATHFGSDVLEAYNSINPLYGAARADFFRYLLMYQDGGVPRLEPGSVHAETPTRRPKKPARQPIWGTRKWQRATRRVHLRGSSTRPLQQGMVR